MISLVGAVLAIFPSHGLHLTNFVDFVAICIEDLTWIPYRIFELYKHV